MGFGTYSDTSRSVRADAMGYATKSKNEIFNQRNIHKDMNPYNVKIRESRDSEEHPNTIPIILALDVTGSMGRIPHQFVKDGLPTLMSSLIQRGVEDPQLLFLAVGDHECDRSPLQVAQFESSDELLDKWLTSVWLEEGGGGNGGESYILAHYFAAHHTVHDAFEKRGQKGFLFTIGDEPTLDSIPSSALKEIMGDGQYSSIHTEAIIKEAQKMYNVYHLHIRETSSGARQHVMDGWKRILGQNMIIVEDFREIPKLMAEIIISNSTEKIKTPIYQQTEDSKPQTPYL